MKIDAPLQRAFYEIECIRGNWSVRELRRQIGNLYYERSGLSKDKAKLAELAHSAAEQAEPRVILSRRAGLLSLSPRCLLRKKPFIEGFSAALDTNRFNGFVSARPEARGIPARGRIPHLDKLRG